MSNEITAYFKGTTGVAESVYQYDYGMVMNIEGPDLGDPFEVHFEHTGNVNAVTAIGQDNIVAIPNDCLVLPGTVTAYIYEHTGVHDGETAYVVRFQVINRARNVDIITDEQESVISQAIALLKKPVENFVRSTRKINGYPLSSDIDLDSYDIEWHDDPNLNIDDVISQKADKTVATTSSAGLLPKLGGGTSNFLRADGTWASPGGLSSISVENISDTEYMTPTSSNPRPTLLTKAFTEGVYLVTLFVEWSPTETFAANTSANSGIYCYTSGDVLAAYYELTSINVNGGISGTITIPLVIPSATTLTIEAGCSVTYGKARVKAQNIKVIRLGSMSIK